MTRGFAFIPLLIAIAAGAVLLLTVKGLYEANTKPPATGFLTAQQLIDAVKNGTVPEGYSASIFKYSGTPDGVYGLSSFANVTAQSGNVMLPDNTTLPEGCRLLTVREEVISG